ncbi:MAG: NAD-dependent epimerase/dehydratase [Parcubacteria group bacterium GW2011_GWA1_36_12]|nr:MAG: NAD-dependent epimerase/dehydratase [Parcubacteria group bacterium GW2011_GWA1_36_12]
MKIKGKKILVTGGSGFIGENLIKKLKQLNAQTSNYDISNGNSILDYKNLEHTLKKKFDVIYHLASFSGSKQSNENIEHSLKINTLATTKLLELSVKYSPKAKVIFSNSRLEYGVTQYLPVDEKHPTNPISAYGFSKLASTQIALVFHEASKLDVTIFRTSNVYGPHSKSKFLGYNLINHYIDLASKGRELIVYGDGSQERDYIYIDDLLDAFISALESPYSGQIYNLGFGKGIKLVEMAMLIIKFAGKGKLKFTDWPIDYKRVETGSYVSDIRKIKRELNFSPKIDFEEGINKTISKQF